MSTTGPLSLLRAHRRLTHFLLGAPNVALFSARCLTSYYLPNSHQVYLTRTFSRQVYLKSRLNCVLMRRNFSLNPEDAEEEGEEEDSAVKSSAAAAPELEDEDDDLQIVEEFLDAGGIING